MKRVFLALFLLSLSLASCVSDNGMYRGAGRSLRAYAAGDRAKIVRTAQRFLGVRYMKGGASPGGFDCSGYVMYVYELNGVLLPRSVKRQHDVGKKIGLSQTLPGDLVFFKTSRNRYSHVGIYVGEHEFIHAPSTGKKVSVADLDKPYWKKRYIGSVTFMRNNML
jgi:cell wall-associated NlpC family hydrolase